ncbi:uncharacterized mitochondrial protein-like protein [Tanacetum coccineum]
MFGTKVKCGKPLGKEWQRFVTLVKQSQELKTVSYHKLYDILKQHQNEVNEIRAKRLARTANPLALVAQQQPVYHHQNHPTQNTQYSSTRSQQSTRNRGKAIVTSSAPTYDPEPDTVTEDDEMSKDKEIDKLMALISLSFKKIYKPTNNNLRTSLNSNRANQDNSPRINRGTRYDNQRAVNVAGARENVGTPVVQKSGIQCYNCKEYGHVSRECQKPKRVKDAAYHKEKMLLCKQEEAGVQLNAEQLQEVTPDHVDNSGLIFDDEPIHKVQNNNDNYNVFAMENEHPEQPESSNDIYLAEHSDTNITIDSLDLCYDRVQDDQDDTDDLDQECDLLASLIQKLKCEIDDSKNQNKFLESSNKALVDKLKGEIELQQSDVPVKPPQIITTNTLSNIKLPVLQKDDYDTWAMEMEHYLEYIDNEVWKVIQNGNSKKRVTKAWMMPKRSGSHQDMVGGNANSKEKCKKAVLKQQFERHLLSHLRTRRKSGMIGLQNSYHTVGCPWCLTTKWTHLLPWHLIIGVSSQAKASSSKHKPSHSSGSYSSYATSSSKATPTATPGLADEVIHSFLATNADDVDLIHEDLDQFDDLDLEEMDINWQIAMTAIKIKKF